MTSSHVEILGTVSEARAAGGAASSPMASSAMPADSLAALDSDGSPRHLVVDALNLLTDYFLPVDRGAAPKSDAWTLLAVMQRRVAGFLEACANTTPALVPHFVIDAGWQSKEAATKWRKRREQEVRTHTRTIPLSADTFLADALRAAGAKVYQVEGADGDDIVAVLARALGATSLILSADRDMFRYDDTVLPDAANRVAASFSFAEAAPRGTRASSERFRNKNPLDTKNTKDTKDTKRAPRFGVALHASLTKQPKEGVKPRGSTEMPRFDPSVDFERWSSPYDKLKTVVDHPALGYVRGACSPQTRAFGNLHGHARPLRLAAYRAMGARGRVHERFPEWDEANDAVRWEDADVDVESGAVCLASESATRDASSSSASSSDVGDERAGPSASDACLLEDVSNDTTLADDTKLAETFLRDGNVATNCAVSAELAALRWLRARDPAWRFASARGEDDADSFRGFARFAIVAECFVAARRGEARECDTKKNTTLAVALAMRDAMRDAETENASNVSNVSPSPAPSMARVRETTSGKDRRDVDALYAFPPASHRSIRCAERACGARFVVSAGERTFLAEKGFAPPTRCKVCRDARKAARANADAPKSGARGGRRGSGGANPSPESASPENVFEKTSASPGPSPGTRFGVRPPRTLKTPSPNAKSRADAAAETAERLAALAVSRGEADE